MYPWIHLNFFILAHLQVKLTDLQFTGLFILFCLNLGTTSVVIQSLGISSVSHTGFWKIPAGFLGALGCQLSGPVDLQMYNFNRCSFTSFLATHGKLSVTAATASGIHKTSCLFPHTVSNICYTFLHCGVFLCLLLLFARDI